MIHQEGYLKGPHGLKIFYQAWLPETTPKTMLLIVHGLAEHSGRYHSFAEYFTSNGYAVYGFDHPGHGRSDGARAYIHSFTDFLSPIQTYLSMIRQWHPSLPIFLIGHSMGGLIAALYQVDHQNEFAGAILSGASVKVPSHISSGTIAIGRLLSKLIPKAGILMLDPKGISRDPAVVQAYINDPLVFTGKITARLGAEMLVATKGISNNANKITLPMLILHGGNDPLVEPDASKIFYRLIGSKDKTLKIYDGLYHEVFNEPERMEVLKDVDEWIACRIGSGC